MLANLSGSVVALTIPEGAHHLDLMFSNKLDPPSVVAVRQAQKAHINRWLAEAALRRGAGDVRTAEREEKKPRLLQRGSSGVAAPGGSGGSRYQVQ